MYMSYLFFPYSETNNIMNSTSPNEGLSSNMAAPPTNTASRNKLRENRKKKRAEHPLAVAVKVVNKTREYIDHSYNDFSRVPQEPRDVMPVKIKEMTFAQKVYHILSQDEYSKSVSWLPHGRSFKVHVPAVFEKEVLMKYFGHKRYSSFLRQLNNHGFKLITKGVERNSYYHECMLRGMPHLCRLMPPPRDARRLIPDPENEPNFYDISSRHPLPGSNNSMSQNTNISCAASAAVGPTGFASCAPANYATAGRCTTSTCSKTISGEGHHTRMISEFDVSAASQALSIVNNLQSTKGGHSVPNHLRCVSELPSWMESTMKNKVSSSCSSLSTSSSSNNETCSTFTTPSPNVNNNSTGSPTNNINALNNSAAWLIQAALSSSQQQPPPQQFQSQIPVLNTPANQHPDPQDMTSALAALLQQSYRF